MSLIGWPLLRYEEARMRCLGLIERDTAGFGDDSKRSVQLWKRYRLIVAWRNAI
jgi:hypothetical protein